MSRMPLEELRRVFEIKMNRDKRNTAQEHGQYIDPLVRGMWEGACWANLIIQPAGECCDGTQNNQGAVPWEKLSADGWSIVGMNHYHLAGDKHLFCSMSKNERCIVAEGVDEAGVFLDLEEKAGIKY